MQIAYSLDDVPKQIKPIVLTIGNFDGMHLGHQALLQYLKNIAKKRYACSAVLTFANHPSKVLNFNPTPLICNIEHKLFLIDQAGIDLTILIPFTKEFSEQTPDQFLKKIQSILPFQILILGSDAHIGKNREGDKKMILALAKAMEFTAEYFPDVEKDGQRISSSLIRDCIRQGNLRQAEALLGRPYGIYGEIVKGSGRGTPIGFPTANIQVEGLCLPPLGVYAVSLFIDHKKLDGVANLGMAPTVRQDFKPILEVHLFNHPHSDMYGKKVDVHFRQYIRQERRFQSIEELKQQIAQDILKAKEINHGR